jgi:hypothetical protein
LSTVGSPRTESESHRFHFFRAGGVDQVSLRDGNDMVALDELDQKLWVALAMPSKGIDVDPKTLTLLDHDNDGRIRVKDILAAVEWSKTTFLVPADALVSRDRVELSSIADAKIVGAAKRMLADLGKKAETSISVDDTDAIDKAFAETTLNGDGIVITASTDVAELGKVIEDAIATVGSVVDRSGKPGVDKAKATEFFAEVDTRAAWLAAGTAICCRSAPRPPRPPPHSPQYATSSTTSSRAAASPRTTRVVPWRWPAPTPSSHRSRRRR